MCTVELFQGNEDPAPSKWLQSLFAPHLVYSSMLCDCCTQLLCKIARDRAVSPCSTRWGQYLRNRSPSFPKLFLFNLHSCFLLTPHTEQLQQKDRQILLLLEEKAKIFGDMADSSMQEDMPGSRLLFRANTEEAPKGEAIMKTAINEGEQVSVALNSTLNFSESLGSQAWCLQGQPICSQ